jgi:translation initiation factor IF-2
MTERMTAPWPAERCFLEIVLAKAAKSGVRVNALAKEMGLESKDILSKLKGEGLDWAHNHMSTLTYGQAETVKEWYRQGQLGAGKPTAAAAAEGEETAESAEHEEHATSTTTKARPARKGKRKAEEGDGGDVAVAEAPPEGTAGHEQHAAAGEEEPDSSGGPAVAERHAPPERPHAERPTRTPAAPPSEPPAVKLTPHVVPAMPTAPPQPTEGHKIAAETPAAAPTPPAPPQAKPPAAPGARPPTTDGIRQQVQRPTVTLANRAAPPPVAPRAAFVPKPAQISGPRVVREEKPDVVATPRPARRPVGEGQASGPGLNTARPQAGRGVKRTDDEEEAEKKKAAARASLSTRRRGSDGRRGQADEKLREFTDADLIERKERIEQATKSRETFDRHIKTVTSRGTHVQAKSAQEKGEAIEMEEPITVRTLSAALGIKVNELLGKLMRQGVMANINASLDVEVAQTMALEYGLELQLKRETTLEQEIEQEFASREKDPAKLVTRPPVVTILGHVDHGKTSLLDKIRSANVAAGEAGGITQHIAAWMVTLGEGDKAKRVTFIDTPGHQAFTSMRARGANMTDVVVLVVSAAEGVQPQTVESINHAKAAGVPIVVAMNKIDRADANEQQVLGQLAANGLNPVEWGGDTEVVRTSALTGQGIPELIEILDLQSQIMELKADPTAPANGTVIESMMHSGLGAAATVLVQNGTLKVGEVMLCGNAYGRIRSLLNDKGAAIQEAGPSTPVIVAGLNELPSSGDKFFILDHIDLARTVADDRANRSRQTQLGQMNRVTGANLLSTLAAQAAVSTINLIIKADVQGSLETLVNTVTAQNTAEVKVRVIHSGVGAISESDVQLAMATKTKPNDNRVAIIGFHVVADDAARLLAEQNHVDVKTYRVIYEIFDDLKKSLSGMLAPEVREKLHGHCEVRQVFKVSRLGNIAGCMVTDGHIQRGSKIRLIRDGKIITEGLSIETLKRVKDDVKEVKSGFECGIKLAGYDDIKVGDRYEAYIQEKFERTL